MAGDRSNALLVLNAGSSSLKFSVFLDQDPPRALLRGIPGIELREVADADICCGSAGVYNLLFPQAAGELGERKARSVLATGAQLLVTANPGCLLQVAASVQRLGGRIGLAHTVEVLDASLRGRTVSQLHDDLSLRT